MGGRPLRGKVGRVMNSRSALIENIFGGSLMEADIAVEGS